MVADRYQAGRLLRGIYGGTGQRGNHRLYQREGIISYDMRVYKLVELFLALRDTAPRCGYCIASPCNARSRPSQGLFAGREDAWRRQEADIIAAGREGRIVGGVDVHRK